MYALNVQFFKGTALVIPNRREESQVLKDEIRRFAQDDKIIR